jgi:hypothetical protein
MNFNTVEEIKNRRQEYINQLDALVENGTIERLFNEKLECLAHSDCVYFTTDDILDMLGDTNLGILRPLSLLKARSYISNGDMLSFLIRHNVFDELKACGFDIMIGNCTVDWLFKVSFE